MLFPLLSLAASAFAALPAVEIKGNAFYEENSDNRFFLRGVAYQPGGSSNLTDPLADVSICSRDIPYFKELGLNTLRVYSVDNTLNHSECMSLLDDAGIYVVIDVNHSKQSLSRGDTNCSYNIDYMTEIFATIDSFAGYNNTLGFFAANELVNEEQYMSLSPYIKAVTRDMKQYMAAQKYRAIPVGYSAADVAEIRYDLAHYLNCGDDSDERIDMLGINDYSWCGQSSFLTSGYKEKVSSFTGYSIPVFLSEFGCNEVVSSRPFTEVNAIYSTLMSSVFSGGVVYQYFQDENKYGLVDIDSNGNVTVLTDFDNLQKQFSSVSDPTGDAGASTSYNFSNCPANQNFSLSVPPQPSGLTELIKKGPDGNNIGFDASTQNSCDFEDDNDVDTSEQSSSSNFAVTSSSSSTESPTSSFTSTVSQSSVGSVSSISATSNRNDSSSSASNSLVSIFALLISIMNF